MDYERILEHVSENDMLILLGILLFLAGGMLVAWNPGFIWLRLGFLTSLGGVLMYAGGMLGMAREVARLEG